MNRLNTFAVSSLVWVMLGSLGLVGSLAGTAAQAEEVFVSRTGGRQPVYSNARTDADSRSVLYIGAPAPLLLARSPARSSSAAGPWVLGPGGILLRAQPAPPPSADGRRDLQTISLVRQAAERHRLDFDLLMALIRQESGFNPGAVSHAGARGLMQLMPGTARDYGVTRIHDPGENIAGGSAYLRDLFDRFGRIDLALAAYNAGEGAVIRYGRRIPPFPETQNYVRVVMADYARRQAGR